jgi:formylglycine-generating enzyme required for sulfatase activity
LPVVNVSLDDARNFAKWRSERDKVEYRLPTEAEWEYAARNGADATLYPWGNNLESIEKLAIINASSPGAVGSMPKGANKWGVLDLIGNVWEWTDSEYVSYPGSPGTIKSTVTEYVIRGGGAGIKVGGDKLLYFSPESEIGKPFDSSFRNYVKPDRIFGGLGFRLIREIKN